MFKNILKIFAVLVLPIVSWAADPQKMMVNVNYWRLGEATCARTFELVVGEETIFCEGESQGLRSIIRGTITVKNENQVYISTIAEEMTASGVMTEITRMRMVTLAGKLTQSAQYDASGEIIQLAVRANIQELR